MVTDTKTEEKIEENSKDQEVKENLKNRLLLPIVIPLASAAIIALLGISYSRIFLAGGHKGEEAGLEAAAEEVSKSTAPVLWAVLITLFVLFGAAGISMMKRMRSTSLILVVAGFMVASVLAGSVLAGTSDESKEEVLVGKPTEAELLAADPVPRLAIDALPTNQFQAKEFEAVAGITEIEYVGKGGGHVLKFKDTQFSWFNLAVNGTATESAPINLEAGTYYIFCPVPGHEAAGMYADLIVK